MGARMRNYWVAALIVVGFFRFGATAGEHLLGTIEVLDAGSVTNVGTATPFNVPSNSKISVQPPDAGLWVGVDVASCSPSSSSGCVLLGASMLLPTSTGASINVTRPDAGTYTGGVTVIRCPNGVTSCLANVFSRSGTE